MLTGDPPYTGSTAQAILGKILLGEVTRPAKLRRTMPANVEAAILKALERLPADRFATVAEMAAALKDRGFRHGVEDPVRAGWWNRMTVGWASLAAVLAVVALLLFLARFKTETTPEKVIRFRVTLEEDQLFAAATGIDVAMAPDGSRIVYVGIGGDAGTRLFQRGLSEFEPTPVPGTNNPSNPAVSPDGLSVAFITGNALKSVSFSGGTPTTVLAEGVSPRGLDWGPDGFLYFTDLEGAIQRVPATGGSNPEVVTSPGPSLIHTGVDVLPGGRGVLITVTGGETDGPRVGVADPHGNPVRLLFSGTMARSLPPGYLVFSSRSGQLMAAEFDLARLEPTSQPVPVASGLAGTNVLYSEFDLSATGSLAYRAFPTTSPGDLVWVSRIGSVDELDPDWDGDFRNPSLSPDDGYLAVDRVEGGIALWIRDLERGPRNRISLNPTGESRPAWTSDGQSVTLSAYYAERDRDLVTVRADGTGETKPRFQLDRAIEEGVWSPDGEWLVVRTGIADPGSGDILAVRGLWIPRRWP